MYLKQLSSNVIKLRNIKKALSVAPDTQQLYQVWGRVYTIRKHKTRHFIDLHDGSTRTPLQVMLDQKLNHNLNVGTYLGMSGQFITSKGGKQNLDFVPEEINFNGPCDPLMYPFADSNSEEIRRFRMFPHLRPMILSYASLLRVKSEIEMALHQIMNQMDFYKVHTPSLTSSDGEANGDLFRVERTSVKESKQITDDDTKDIDRDNNHGDDDFEASGDRKVKQNYFSKDVYLVVSSQLHLEMLSAGLSRAYTIANAFRGENSRSKRHLSEFSMIEAEESNITDISKLMDRVESIIKFMCQYMINVSKCSGDFLSLVSKNKNEDNLVKLGEQPFARITYKEALEIVNNISLQDADATKLNYGCDIGKKQERQLLDYTNNLPIFITHYPENLKPFYMLINENGEAENFDLLAPKGGEICGAGLREHSYDKLKQKISKFSPNNQQNDVDMAWYLENRLYGTYPHGGFGIGFDRLLQSMLGINNIKDANFFPRHCNYCPM